jgi:hypothetical protein
MPISFWRLCPRVTPQKEKRKKEKQCRAALAALAAQQHTMRL